MLAEAGGVEQDPSCVVALDVGATESKGAVLRRGQTMPAASSTRTLREGGPQAVVEGLCVRVASLLAQARAEGLDPLAVGVVVPGLLDEGAGVVRFAVNLGWRDLPLRDLLRERTGLPVALGHDVRAGGLAEVVWGAARGREHVLFVPVGTGVAGALLLGGQPYLGNGAAGEIGHLPADPDGEVCGCGGRGCVETIASASAIARRYAQRTGESVSPQEVAGRAQAGDDVAVRVWDEAVDALAVALHVASRLLDPELVVIGGGLARTGEQLLTPLRERVVQRAGYQQAPEIVAGSFGALAGCAGAGLLAWQVAGADGT